MSNNYIEIDYQIVKIHKDGKVCTLKNPNNVKMLLDICHKHNIYFRSNKGTIRNADKIIREFDSHFTKKKDDKKLKISPENINKVIDGFKLVKKSKLGKVIMATGIAATIGITSMSISNAIKKSHVDSIPYESQTIIEEVPEYIAEPESYQDKLSPIINVPESIVKFDSSNEDGIYINDELNKMMTENKAFHFSYENRTTETSYTNAKQYEDLFIKYGNRYGVDPNLLIAMAAQESSGNHYGHLNGNYGIGIMQIEKSAHLNSTLKAYNFETGEMDSIKVTEDNLEDLETNIQMGTMILRNNIEANNYNIPLALQSYNFGPGNMSTVINRCSESTGLLKGDIKDNITNPEWLNYRKTIHVGDPLYIEHVFSYVESGTVLSIKDRDGNNINLQIVNDNVNTLQIQ